MPAETSVNSGEPEIRAPLSIEGITEPMRRHGIQYYLDGRLFEWTFSVCCLIFGIGLLVFPTMSRGSIIRLLYDIVGWPLVGVIFFVVGVASVAALIVNGRSMSIGPRVRACCAIWRAGLWSEFALSMAHVSVVEGHLSPMVIFFSVFTASEFYVVYRAVLDVRDN